MAGLVPPFSPFFVEVLEVYAIHMVHLVPNAIVTLAQFAHACETFISVQPLVELFCHLFSLCQSPSASSGPGLFLGRGVNHSRLLQKVGLDGKYSSFCCAQRRNCLSILLRTATSTHDGRMLLLDP
jgi:hypothetical protein